MTAPLFTPFDLGPVRLSNRIVVSPMCQYSANDGSMNDCHLQHLMAMAMSGAGLVVVEATAVERIGRITHGCTAVPVSSRHCLCLLRGKITGHVATALGAKPN